MVREREREKTPLKSLYSRKLNFKHQPLDWVFTVQCLLSYERNHFTCTNGFIVPYTYNAQTNKNHNCSWWTRQSNDDCQENCQRCQYKEKNDDGNRRTSERPFGKYSRIVRIQMNFIFLLTWIGWMASKSMRLYVYFHIHFNEFAEIHSKIHWTFSRKWKKFDWISGKSIVASNLFRCAAYAL